MGGLMADGGWLTAGGPVAVRVRKLARELERTPDDLLLVLKELGYERFRSPDDMVSEDVAARLRRAARSLPPRAIGSAPPPRPTPRRTTSGDEDDLMARLVPGVVREGASGPARVSSRPLPKVVAPALAPRPPDAVQEARQALAEERTRLEELRTALAEERKALSALRAEIEAERARAVEERRAVEDAEREAERAHERRLAGVDRISLVALLEERGLRGLDEGERALAALASHHQLGRVLSTLVPADPEAVRRLLAERLVLVGGAIPVALSALAAVTVSEDRADIPGGDRLAKALGRMGEQLLLNGYRRIALAGVPPRWHALLREGLDRRVELVFRPAGAWSREDLARMDLLVVWRPSGTPAVGPSVESRPVEGRGRMIEVAGGAVGDLVERVTQALSQGAS